MPLCSLLLTGNFFPLQHLSPATQGVIDQGVSFSVDSNYFLVSLMYYSHVSQGHELLTNVTFSDNIPLPSVSIATAPGYSLQISSY